MCKRTAETSGYVAFTTWQPSAVRGKKDAKELPEFSLF